MHALLAEVENLQHVVRIRTGSALPGEMLRRGRYAAVWSPLDQGDGVFRADPGVVPERTNPDFGILRIGFTSQTGNTSG